jgi:hypothetical protein
MLEVVFSGEIQRTCVWPDNLSQTSMGVEIEVDVSGDPLSNCPGLFTNGGGNATWTFTVIEWGSCTECEFTATQSYDSNPNPPQPTVVPTTVFKPDTSATGDTNTPLTIPLGICPVCFPLISYTVTCT